jgi:hypothetical protein
VVNEARKRGFVTTARRFDHAPSSGTVTGAPPESFASSICVRIGKIDRRRPALNRYK